MAGRRRRGAGRTATTVALVLVLSACSSGPVDVMATDTCPEPLHRILVATQGSTRPSPPLDPDDQHPVTVSVDDGTGSGGTSTVETCQVLTLALPSGTVQQGRFQVLTGQGTGSLQLVDQPTHIRESDDGSGAQDYGQLTGWYALVEDPAPGEYRVSRGVEWPPVPPPADTTRALDRTPEAPATGVLDLVVTID